MAVGRSIKETVNNFVLPSLLFPYSKMSLKKKKKLQEEEEEDLGL